MSGGSPRLFSDRYARLIAAAVALCEPGARPEYGATAGGGGVPERLLQCIWFDQLVQPDALRTLDGRAVRVLAPGFWNFEAGPDFLRAEIQLGDAPPARGDVEVHFRPRDWTAHGHGLDPEYNDTMLHVVYAHGPGAPDVHTAAGASIPQLELAPVLVDELDALRAQLDTADYPFASTQNVGRCHAAGLTGESDAFWSLIALAGEARVVLKAGRAAAVADDWDQVCWTMLLRALGYKAFAGSCGELARRAPYACVRDIVAASADPELSADAALLGMAGLLPPDPFGIADPDGRRRAEQLVATWEHVRGAFSQPVMSPDAWRAPHVRPANRPARRLAAAGRLLVRTRERGLAESFRACLTGGVAPRAAWRTLEALLAVDDGAFWGYRGDVAGKPWPRAQRLVGPARARVLAIDAVVPSLLAWARATHDTHFESRLHAVMSSAPAQASNGKLRLALYRMNGAPNAWPRTARTALHGQGLLHVLQEWCLERPTCEGCAVLRVLADGVTVPEKKRAKAPF